MAFLDIYGGSGGAETILTSKYSGSTSSVSKMADSGPPGAEKLIFSDKTSSSLIDCSPKRTFLVSKIKEVNWGENQPGKRPQFVVLSVDFFPIHWAAAL